MNGAWDAPYALISTDAMISQLKKIGKQVQH